MGGPRVYRINQLPHDIICYIFAFLNVGDACRARLSSSGWLHIPDSRVVLHFDSLNVLGKEIPHENIPAVQSKFVNIIDWFLQVWTGEKMHKLVVRFLLGKEHAPHIDRWIATSARMEVEEIELDFSGISHERYVFPSDVIHFEKAPYLNRLCLKSCTFCIPSKCTTWSSNLTTLKFNDVALDQEEIDFILSASSNLISLTLFNCNLPRRLVRIGGQHTSLKKLSICDTLSVIRLICPNLEEFEYHGSISSIMFSHVPLLKEAKLWPQLEPMSMFLYRLTTYTPVLEVLSLSIKTEVESLYTTFSSLRQLNISVSIGFGLLSITHLLNASPFLETLQIKLNRGTGITSNKKGKGKYRRRPHFNLKEVKIEGFHDQWNEMELAIYILKCSMALKQMVIELNGHSRLGKYARSRLLKIRPTAEVIIV